MTVLVVDDEPPARENLRALIARSPGLVLVGECGDGRAAVTAIRRERPDLVLLDVQMPGLDGFGVIREVGAREMPDIVFVTAFDRYAIEAFEVSAVDYLLKPFSDERFAAAVERALERRTSAGRAALADGLAAVLEHLAELRSDSSATRLRRIPVSKAGRVRLLDPSDVDWIEAAADYVRLHVGTDTYLLRSTMNALERRLDPRTFIRIHRSTIVNLERIAEFVPDPRGDHAVVLQDGTRLRLARGRREEIAARIGMRI